MNFKEARCRETFLNVRAIFRIKMMFCPKCGSMVLPKKEGNKNVIRCSCGYTNAKAEVVEIKEEVKKKETFTEPASDNDDMLPVTEGECPKCKNDKAYFWLVQTRAGDEPETKFMKCTKCKHTWRDYS